MSLSPNVEFNPVEFYWLAGRLYEQHKNENNEVIYRTIIGRSYYSAFLCARQSADIKDSSPDVHRKVFNYFQAKNVTVANQLKDLRQLRNSADYILENKISKREAIESLRLAKKILTTLNYSL